MATVDVDRKPATFILTMTEREAAHLLEILSRVNEDVGPDSWMFKLWEVLDESGPLPLHGFQYKGEITVTKTY